MEPVLLPSRACSKTPDSGCCWRCCPPPACGSTCNGCWCPTRRRTPRPTDVRAAICLTFIPAGWGRANCCCTIATRTAPKSRARSRAGYYGRPLDAGTDRRSPVQRAQDQQGFRLPATRDFSAGADHRLALSRGADWIPLAADHPYTGERAAVVAGIALAAFSRIDRDPHRTDLGQLRRGAGNQAAATDPGGERAAGRMCRRADGGQFSLSRVSAGPGDHQAATCAADRGLADAVGCERLAPASAFCLELRTDHSNFSGRVGVHPAGMDEGVSQCRSPPIASTPEARVRCSTC